MDKNSTTKLCLNIREYTFEDQRNDDVKKRKSMEEMYDRSSVKLPRLDTEEASERNIDNTHVTEDANIEENFDDSENISSSLFTGNPDIPRLPEKVVTRVVEKMFSENSFSSLNIAYQIVSNVEKLGFKSMTMVQQMSIPPILNDKDTLIKSQTGSGKTLAYAIPIIHKLMMLSPKVNRSDGVYAIIIVPTRELAIQTYDWFENLCKSCVWVVPGYLIGGEKKKSEKKRLKKGVNILVATPGRLIDHIHHTQSLSLHKVQFFVIDEADRLLEMGYEQSITSIVESLNEQSSRDVTSRQTILLSATLTADVQKLAGISLHSPEVIDVSSSDVESTNQDDHCGPLTSDTLVTPENLSHFYLLIPAKLRLVTLAGFILSKCRYGNERKMLVFMATQDMVDYHTDVFKYFLTNYLKEKQKDSLLKRRADKVLAGGDDNISESESEESEDEEDDEGDEGRIHFLKLHGNMTQQDRSSVFKTFQSATAGVLLCTDVASRGLDLPEVHWIVQYNAACTAADYVHRVGRTARVNAEGSALAFLAPSEASYVKMLQDHRIILKEMKMEKILLGLLDPSTHCRGKPEHHAIEAATRLQLKIETLILSDSDLHTRAKKGYISFVRAYASYPREVREMFNFKALHLGHYAKCFGLRDTPRTLGASTAFRAKKDIKEYHEKKERRRQVNVMQQKSGQLPRLATMSEFDSGLDTFSKQKSKSSKKFNKSSAFSKINKIVSKKNQQIERNTEKIGKTQRKD